MLKYMGFNPRVDRAATLSIGVKLNILVDESPFRLRQETIQTLKNILPEKNLQVYGKMVQENHVPNTFW